MATPEDPFNQGLQSPLHLSPTASPPDLTDAILSDGPPSRGGSGVGAGLAHAGTPSNPGTPGSDDGPPRDHTTPIYPNPTSISFSPIPPSTVSRSPAQGSDTPRRGEVAGLAEGGVGRGVGVSALSASPGGADGSGGGRDTGKGRASGGYFPPGGSGAVAGGYQGSRGAYADALPAGMSAPATQAEGVGLPMMADLFSGLGQSISQGIAGAMQTLTDQPRGRSTPAADHSHKGPTAKEPTLFNGKKRELLSPFIAQNQVCFETSPNKFATEKAKVMFSGSYLDGDARDWFLNHFRSPDQPLPDFLLTWNSFTRVLRANFGIRDEQLWAEAELEKLHMKDWERCSLFGARFDSIAFLLPDWGSRNKRNEYFLRLAPRLRTQFVSSGTLPSTDFDLLKDQAENLDNIYWTNAELTQKLTPKDSSTSDSKSGGQSKSSSSKPTNSTSAKTALASTSKSGKSTPAQKSRGSSGSSGSGSATANPLADKLGTDGKLIQAERDRRMKEGLCLYCGGKGHVSVDCQKRKSKSDSARSTRADSASLPKQTGRATVTLEAPTQDKP